jgi:hypothetical protein
MESVSFIIGADLVPTKTNFDLFNNRELTSLFGEGILSLLKGVDYRIFNLEVPLTDTETPIKKNGPVLSAPTSTIEGICEINPSLLTLANNHILDHGELGLNSTINILNKYNIPYIGAGNNIESASKPYLFEKKGIKIGVYACAEHEFTIATNDSAGANPFNELDSYNEIANLKSICNYVIVLYHGGKEYYRYPSPNLQKVCRSMVDYGADLVVCQHSHCIGSYENYKEASIIYGQGNFIFDKSKSEFWKTGMLIKVEVSKSSSDINYFPIVKLNNLVRLGNKNEAQEILDEFYKRSKYIKQQYFITEEYDKFAKSTIEDYLNALHGDNILFRILRKIYGKKIVEKLYSEKSLLTIYNYIVCESHRELLLRGLELRREIY